MLNFIIVLSVLAAFLFLELVLSVRVLFMDRKGMNALCERYAGKAIGIIFSMFSAYRNFHLSVDNRMGVDFPERFLLVSNHQSLLDIPTMMKIMPPGRNARFMAKRELGAGIPLISMLLRLQGHCLVRRTGDPVDSMRIVTAFAARCARENTCPVVFPEGTRSRDGALGEFHSAGVRKVLEVESLPIVVVTVDGGWQSATLGSFFSSFGKVPYRVRFSAVLDAPAGRRETLDAIALCRSIIADSLADMRRS
jgi:1-acyl-sn-glycerol-3-phosphate acyltransferase